MKTKIESLGIYLPDKVVTTQEVMDRCKKPGIAGKISKKASDMALNFMSKSKNKKEWNLEQITGIEKRRVSEGEFSKDLAIKACKNALAMSKYKPEEIDMIVCSSISKYDTRRGFCFEPATSLEIRKAIGANNALNFDIVNACAGMFSGINIVDSFIKAGVIKCGIVVSGEYITALTDNAVKEIKYSTFDGQFASLTLGDCGAALILDKSEDEKYGFHDMSFVTGAAHCDLCVAHPSKNGPGGVMITKPVKLHRETIGNAAIYMKEFMDKVKWTIDDLTWVIPHQTSARAIKRATKVVANYLNTFIPEVTITNVQKYGNTSSTTHSLALHENILQDKIKEGDNIMFVIGASGIVIGFAAYTMDDLPQRYKSKNEKGNENEN